MIAPEILGALTAGGVQVCLIGAHALAYHGVARFTADIDLMTMDARVLAREFWGEGLAPLIGALRVGDDDDPLAGLVRFTTTPRLDLVVGRGRTMRDAVASATADDTLGLPVVSPIALALLKLEAGGPQDLADVVRLCDAQAMVGAAGLAQEIALRAPTLSAWGRAAWERVRPDLLTP